MLSLFGGWFNIPAILGFLGPTETLHHWLEPVVGEGALIVTHGQIGASLLESAAQIIDASPRLTATLGVSRNDDPDDLVLRVRRLVKQLDEWVRRNKTSATDR